MVDMDVKKSPSPNWDERTRAVDMIVLHYTGMVSGQEALDRLRRREAGVSSHYLIMENGETHLLVDEDKRAWHAGISSWQGDPETNARSIGIEIVNPGHEWGYREFPQAQVAEVEAVVADIMARHKICPTNVIGHSDVAPLRKEDPGELFPWARFAEKGLTIAPFQGVSNPEFGYMEAIEALREIGYDAPDRAHGAAVLAFQRHFCPSDLGQSLSPLTRTAIVDVLAKFRQHRNTRT